MRLRSSVGEEFKPGMAQIGVNQPRYRARRVTKKVNNPPHPTGSCIGLFTSARCRLYEHRSRGFITGATRGPSLFGNDLSRLAATRSRFAFDLKLISVR